MRILYGDGFSEEDRKIVAPAIISNLLKGTFAILEECERLGHGLAAIERLLCSVHVTNAAQLGGRPAAAARACGGGRWQDGQHGDRPLLLHRGARL